VKTSTRARLTAFAVYALSLAFILRDVTGWLALLTCVCSVAALVTATVAVLAFAPYQEACRDRRRSTGLVVQPGRTTRTGRGSRAGIVRLAVSLGCWDEFQEECWKLEEYA
jgi:hypothetical protein